MNLTKVEGYSNLMKDTANGGVVNTDSTTYKSYLKSKQMIRRGAEINRSNSDAITSIQNEINSIKDDVHSIKSMLKQILEKASNGSY